MVVVVSRIDMRMDLVTGENPQNNAKTTHKTMRKQFKNNLKNIYTSSNYLLVKNIVMKPLQISVSFFSTVVVTSYYTQNYFYSCLYTLMIIFGIMNHALDRKQDNGKNMIHIIDTFLAHTAFVCILYDYSCPSPFNSSVGGKFTPQPFYGGIRL